MQSHLLGMILAAANRVREATESTATAVAAGAERLATATETATDAATTGTAAAKAVGAKAAAAKGAVAAKSLANFLMPALTPWQHAIITDGMYLAMVCMFAATAFFLLVRNDMTAPYRPAMLSSAMVTGIAGFIYTRIVEEWRGAYSFDGTRFVPTVGIPSADVLRYVDWLITVPLLCVSLILALNLTEKQRNSMMPKLVVSAALMVLLGYVGEVSKGTSTRLMYGVVSCLPFFFIVSVLWGELEAAVKGQPQKVRKLLATTRLVMFSSWMFYPITYFVTLFGFRNAEIKVILEVGYSFADVSAKCFYGLMLYQLAAERMKNDTLAAEKRAAELVAVMPAAARAAQPAAAAAVGSEAQTVRDHAAASAVGPDGLPARVVMRSSTQSP